MARRGGSIRSWADLKQPRSRAAGAGRSACSSARRPTHSPPRKAARTSSVVRFDGATDAMTAVQNGQYDATLQDLPAARFYRDRFPGLELAGPPESHGYYVIYVRQGDGALRDALDQGIARLIASGELRRLYEKYGIWTEAQTRADDDSRVRSRSMSRPTDRRRLGPAGTVPVAAASTRPA